MGKGHAILCQLSSGQAVFHNITTKLPKYIRPPWEGTTACVTAHMSVTNQFTLPWRKGCMKHSTMEERSEHTTKDERVNEETHDQLPPYKS